MKARQKNKKYYLPVFVKSVLLTFTLCILLPVFSLGLYAILAMVQSKHGENSLSIWSDYGMSPKTLCESLEKEWSQQGKITKKSQIYLQEHDMFALVLNENGKIVWQQDIPKSFQKQYSIVDIAKMARFYKDDYPIFTWEMEEKLLIVGYPKGSIWKYQIIYPEKSFALMLFWICTLILCYIIFAFFFAYFTEWLKRRTFKKQYEKEEARAEWIRAISHDVRTPLTLILGYADELAEEVEISDYGKKEASMIKAQAMRIGQLIADLNLTTKLEYNMQPLQQEVIEIAPMLRKILSNFLNEGLLEKYELDVQLRQDIEGIQIYGDPALIERAIYNLVQNSVKHNENGCVITVSARKERKWFILTIADNGEQEVDFQQLDHATGLGLKIVRNVLKNHKGKVVFKKNHPHGFCSELYFRILSS